MPSVLGYVRDVDTPVLLTDVLASLEALITAAERAGDTDLVRSARRVESLVTTLRTQFVDDLIGPRSPSQTAVARDRERDRQAAPDDDATLVRAPSPRAASNS